MDLPPDLLALLKQPSTCYIATTMPDGSPQVTQVWGDSFGMVVDKFGVNWLVNIAGAGQG